MNAKRLIIATLLGILFGFVCYGFAASGETPISYEIALNIILGRMLIGVAIGISRLKLKHWSIHGAVMGFIFGLPSAFGALLSPETAEVSHSLMFISTLVMGIIYGFLIEFVTSVIFKAR